MKKLYSLLIIVLLNQILMGQTSAKKTSFMVMPHDKWMVTNKFNEKIDNQGVQENQFNYKQAILEHPDLLSVIAKVEGILNERGLKIVNLESKLNTLNNDNAEKMVLQSKTSKSSVSENAYDKLMKTAKADIIVKIDWNVITSGPKKQISFTMQGIDSYTNQPVATVTDPGSAPSFESSIPVLLEEAVLKKIDVFLSQIETHATDVFENGRKVKLYVEKWDSWENDFETEYNGKELREIIEEWLQNNTIKGSFETTSGENDIEIDARIPVFDETGKAMTATMFIRNLSKFLKASPFLIENKLMDKYGLGKSKIILGEK